MSKVATYLSILGSIIIGFHLAGLIVDTGTWTILQLLKDPQEIFNENYYLVIITALTLFAGAVITVGFLVNQKLDQAVLTSFTILLIFVGWDLLGIYNAISTNVNHELALLIFSPMIMVYILTVLEWWRGQS